MKVIYLIEGELNHYKIGITGQSATSRLKQLQTGNPIKLSLIEEFETQHHELEGLLHRKFLTEALHGEWFLLKSTDVFAFRATCRQLEKQIILAKKINQLD
jgi:hypothetical protein